MNEAATVAPDPGGGGFVTVPSERLASVDALRGLALLGIALSNVAMFAWPASAVVLGMLPNETASDLGADLLTQAFIVGRIHPLFSLLFGAGMGALVLRSAARGSVGRRTLWLRCGVLLLLGLLHTLLVWDGDILTTHAIVGLALLVGSGWSRRTLLSTGAVLFGLSLVLMSALFASMWQATSEDPGRLQAFLDSQRAEVALELLQLAHASWSGALVDRVDRWLTDLPDVLLSLPLFLMSAVVGFVLVRDGSVARAQAAPARWRSAGRLGLSFGVLAGAALLVMLAMIVRVPPNPLGATEWVRMMVGFLSGPVVAMALFAIAVTTPSLGQGRTGEALAAMGRLSLSHYLVQSLVFSTLFSGWGLGLHEVGPAALAMIATAVWTVQLVGSKAWLDRYHLGPAEWLWRSLSSLERLPFERDRSEVGEGRAAVTREP